MPRFRVMLPCAFGALCVAVAALPTTAAARVIPGDAFFCAEARQARAPRGAPPLPTFHARVGVSVVDRFTRPLPSERYTLDVKRAEAFCPPVRLDDGELVDALSGLEVYEARRTRRKPAPPPLPTVSETIESALGVVRLRIGTVAALGVPTLATGSVGGSGPERDHLACYQVKEERGPDTRRGALRIDVQTSEGVRAVEVRKPVRLCVPASVRGDDPGAPKHPVDLLCFDARLARDTRVARAPGSELVATRNPFGHEVLKLGAARMLCVPAARTDVAVPTPTPFATLTPPPTPVPTATPVRTPRPPRVRIEPVSTTALVRDRVCFSAQLELPDERIVDVSATALWRVVDGTIAVPSGFEGGKKCFVGVGLGTTAMTARDIGTGAVSAPAALTAEWPIVRLSVSPRQMGMRPGETNTLTTIATLSGGRTRNVTQQVRYESVDPAVVLAPNVAGNRSRIEAAATGATSVVVSDTLSSLSDIVGVSVGALQTVLVDPGPLLFPGERTSLQTTGFFGAGFTSNLTQTASYESSDPAVVVATNAPGDRSRIEGVHPGTAVITAIDPVSGIRSSCCGTISVLGDLLDLFVSPSIVTFRTGVGSTLPGLRATGRFVIPPSGQGGRVITDRVVWSASPPGVVGLGTIGAGDRKLLVVEGPGEAQVVATEPGSGTARAVTVTVYDHLDRIEVGDSRDDPTALEPDRAIPVGGTSRYFAHGYFDGARHALLTEATLVASDPTVVAFSSNSAVGLRPGTVVISALDQPSGRSSDDPGGRSAVLVVFGDIARLVLSPSTATLDVGQARTLTTIAHHLGGSTELYTQQAEYASSDPNVVVATNDLGNRSRILAVGPGTATISARDPITGVTSSDSGDDTVVTVRGDDPVVRIVVSPSTRRVPASSTSRFTAAAVLASGDTVNVTQRVQWSSSAPAVASALNLDGDRSRIDAHIPGVATISAYDPVTAQSSTDSGNDATIEVVALATLTLTPATVQLTVGGAFSLTTVGSVASGASINVTQDAVYTSSDPAVVRATNQAGNRSRIEALAPGVAIITAVRASAYPQATDSNPITVTVLPAP